MFQGRRTYMYGMVRTLQEQAAREEEIDMALRGQVRQVRRTRSTAPYRQRKSLSGPAANFDSSPLQRCLRVVHAVSQHFVIAASNYEPAGRIMMASLSVLSRIKVRPGSFQPGTDERNLLQEMTKVSAPAGVFGRPRDTLVRVCTPELRGLRKPRPRIDQHERGG